MYRENYINSLRAEMVATVEKNLTPAAKEYGYSDVPLESTIKWRPMVLIIGNYSSGKSTLINEFMGADIQAIGQAPTDDSFTIITYGDAADDNQEIQVTQERDGKFLLNDPDYPFEILKKHGQRFAAHFRLKKVNSPFLKNLALIDTPGMLDSITERDRGYNYQEVIGDLAQLADLVLVLFDPHKAGTVRESHTSLRETITSRTFEDRVLFVLNRIDECSSLSDLLQVYGTLCWNLSQITGRKDIPSILLTYSSRAAQNYVTPDGNRGFLHNLENQRQKLKNSVLDAPRYRLDNLATFVETHAERLDLLMEAILSYRKQLRRFNGRFGAIGIMISLIAGIAAIFTGASAGLLSGFYDPVAIGAGGVATCLCMVFWMLAPLRYFKSVFHRNYLKNIDKRIPLDTQTRKDNWQAVRELAYKYLKETNGRFRLRNVKQQYADVHQVFVEGTREIRKALNELSNIKFDEAATAPGETATEPENNEDSSHAQAPGHSTPLSTS